MKAILLAVTLIAVAACKPEKDPSTGATGGPVATGSTQAEACDKLLRNKGRIQRRQVRLQTSLGRFVDLHGRRLMRMKPEAFRLNADTGINS
jgi:hypothetical protein